MSAVALLAKAVFIAVFGFGLWMVTTNSPIFSSKFRVASPDGDWQSQRSTDHYHRSRYLLAKSRAFFGAALETEEPNRRRLLFEEADALAAQSVRLAPADAYGWMTLAFTRRQLGRDYEALEMAARSQALSPSMRVLALERLQAVGDLWELSTTDQRLGMLSDLALLATLRGDGRVALNRLLERVPELARMLYMAERLYPDPRRRARLPPRPLPQ